MIIILMLIALLLISAGLLTFFILYGKSYKSTWYGIQYRRDTETGRTVSVALIVMFTLFLTISGAVCIGMNAPMKNDQIRIEYNNNVTSLNETYNILLNTDDSLDKYTAIQQYNNDVRDFKTEIQQAQYVLSNPWINWFESYVYAEFDSNAVSYYTVGN